MSALRLPDWYGRRAAADFPDSPPRSGRSALAVRRGLASLAEALAVELSGTNRVESWLARLEPRAKLMGLLVLIFGATLLHGLWPLAFLLGLTLLLAATGRLPLRRLTRLWLGVPLFTAALILPAALNWVTPGHPLLTLWHFGAGARLGPWPLPVTLTVTDAGLVVAARFLLRSVCCLTLAALLVTSTAPAALISALRRLGMPRVFGLTLAMMQTYLALLLRVAEEIHLAKLSRTLSPGSLRSEQRWVAAGIGALFSRTYRLAEGVRLAMLSRGYDGELQVGRVPALRLPDYLWVAGVILLLAALLLADHLT